jgi:hypothetical protein
MLTSYIYGSILKMLQGSEAHILFSLYWDRKEATMFTVKMIMVDECGDEVVVDTFNINGELDEDYVEVWESMKIEKARQRYPEAQRFYFEDSRAMQKLINEEINGWREENDDEIDEWGEMEDDGNMPCDYSGICAGASCSHFFGCQA